MNLLDAGILLLLAAGAIKGYRRGLTGAAGGLLGFFGGIWLASRYYIPFAQFLGDRLGLERLLSKILIPFCAGVPKTGNLGDLAIGGWNSGAFQDDFLPSFWEPVLAVKSGIGGDALAKLFAGVALKIFIFFMIWGFVAFFVDLLSSILTRSVPLFLFGGINRLGGVGFGLVGRGMTLMAVIGILTPVVLSFGWTLQNAGGWGQAFIDSWRSSRLIPYFMNCWNVIAPVLDHLFGVV